MAETIAPDAGATAPKPLPARLFGVITSPRSTYAAVAARPRSLGVMAVVIAVVATGTVLLFSTEVGQRALLEQQVKTLQSFGMRVSDQMYQRMQESVGRAPYTAAIGQLVTLPLFAAIIAGIAIGVFNAIMGGDAKFKQVYAVVAHSGVIIAVQQLFVMPLNYVRESLSSPTNLGVFLPMLDENSFLARLLGSIDLFIIWWCVSLAIGLGVLYRRRTGPIATTLLIVYVVIGIVIAAIKSAVGS